MSVLMIMLFIIIIIIISLSIYISLYLSLHFRCIHVFWYIYIYLYLILILILIPFLDGEACNNTLTKVGYSEQVNPGESVMMEVDLRGEGRERTLHFFISGRQQKNYFYNLPQTVEFCVCILFLFFSLLYRISIIYYSPSYSLYIIISSLFPFSSIYIMVMVSVFSLYH